MSVIAEWLEEMAGDEPIEAVVIGPHDDDYLKEDGHAPFNAAPLNKVMSWAEAKPFLSYEYDCDFGGADCHPVFAWTATKILTITEYDGATSPAWFPRNPVDIKPGFDGADF